MSLTLGSLGVLVLATLFKGADIDIAQGELEQGVAFFLQLVSVLGVYWGRYRKGDLTLWGSRRELLNN